MTELLTMARAAGFEETAPLHAAQLVFRPEVREMCRADRCSSYGKNWCCPPACPSLEEMTRRMKDYGDGVLVETVGAMSDDFDYEAIMAAEALHKERLRRLTGTLYALYGRAAVLPMGAGTCRRCASCTCPHAPCRFPAEQVVSMEAYGLLVSQVCQDCGAGGVNALEPRSVAEVTGDVLLPLTGGQQLIPHGDDVGQIQIIEPAGAVVALPPGVVQPAAQIDHRRVGVVLICPSCIIWLESTNPYPRKNAVPADGYIIHAPAANCNPHPGGAAHPKKEEV